jgi:hypothetical protein
MESGETLTTVAGNVTGMKGAKGIPKTSPSLSFIFPGKCRRFQVGQRQKSAAKMTEMVPRWLHFDRSIGSGALDDFSFPIYWEFHHPN